MPPRPLYCLQMWPHIKDTRHLICIWKPFCAIPVKMLALPVTVQKELSFLVSPDPWMLMSVLWRYMHFIFFHQTCPCQSPWWALQGLQFDGHLPSHLLLWLIMVFILSFKPSPLLAPPLYSLASETSLAPTPTLPLLTPQNSLPYQHHFSITWPTAANPCQYRSSAIF